MLILSVLYVTPIHNDIFYEVSFIFFFEIEVFSGFIFAYLAERLRCLPRDDLLGHAGVRIPKSEFSDILDKMKPKNFSFLKKTS